MENTAYVFLNGVMDSKNLFYKEILEGKKIFSVLTEGLNMHLI